MTLQLTLTKKWFDMIASGQKKIEYREIKVFWVSRIIELDYKKETKPNRQRVFRYFANELRQYPMHTLLDQHCCHIKVAQVQFTNGYSKSSPTMIFSIKRISVGTGYSKWGAEKGKRYIRIHLAEQLPF